MKKLLSLVLALSLVCVFTACGAKTPTAVQQPVENAPVVDGPESEQPASGGAPVAAQPTSKKIVNVSIIRIKRKDL